MKVSKKIKARILARQQAYDKAVNEMPAFKQEAFKASNHRPGSMKK